MFSTAPIPTMPDTVLVVDDDSDDRLIMMEAWKENPLGREIRFVEDGEELLDYLYNRRDYADPSTSPRPGLILLDLNMPRKDGHTVLAEIRSDPDLDSIPIVVLTGEMGKMNMGHAFKLGATSFLHKPVNFSGYQSTLQALRKSWPELVKKSLQGRISHNTAPTPNSLRIKSFFASR